MQELEPGVYSIHFGDQRLLDGRIRDTMQRRTPDVPLLRRIVEYKHPEHLRSPCIHSRDVLESACQQVTLQLTHLQAIFVLVPDPGTSAQGILRSCAPRYPVLSHVCKTKNTLLVAQVLCDSHSSCSNSAVLR